MSSAFKMALYIVGCLLWSSAGWVTEHRGKPIDPWHLYDLVVLFWLPVIFGWLGKSPDNFVKRWQSHGPRE